MGLASHLNVHNTCLLILKARGFTLEVSGDKDPEGGYPDRFFWKALKDNFYFCADNPIELIGLVAVYDYLKPSDDLDYWWRIDGADIYDELLEKAFSDEPTDQ